MEERMKNVLGWNWPKLAGWSLVALLVGILMYRLAIDLMNTGLPEQITVSGWRVLLSQKYIKEIVFTPIWIIIAFLLSRSVEHENNLYKKRENQLYGLIKNKTSVDVRDIREIIQDDYDQDRELEQIHQDASRLDAEVMEINDDDLII